MTEEPTPNRKYYLRDYEAETIIQLLEQAAARNKKNHQQRGYFTQVADHLRSQYRGE